MFVIDGDGRRARRHIADLTARGYEVRSVGAHLTNVSNVSKPALLREFASDLDLPAWFGHNLDALLDALRELESSDGRSIALVWRHASTVRSHDPRLFADVLEILEQVESEREDLRVTLVEE